MRRYKLSRFAGTVQLGPLDRLVGAKGVHAPADQTAVPTSTGALGFIPTLPGSTATHFWLKVACSINRTLESDQTTTTLQADPYLDCHAAGRLLILREPALPATHSFPSAIEDSTQSILQDP